jgi:hypothetical protein
MSIKRTFFFCLMPLHHFRVLLLSLPFGQHDLGFLFQSNVLHPLACPEHLKITNEIIKSHHIKAIQINLTNASVIPGT